MPISINAGDPAQRAANATQLKYGAQESQLQRALAALEATRAADLAAINQYGEGGRSAINQTFEQLFGNLETNRQLVQSQLGIQADAVGAGYREANQIAEAARAAAADRLSKMHGGNVAYSSVNLAEAASPIEQLAAQVIGMNAQSDATRTGNLRNFAAQQDALMRAGISGAQRDRSNRLSGFEAELLRAVASARAAATEQEYGLQGDVLDLITERGSYQNELTADFLDRAFGQQLQAAQYNLSEREAIDQAAYRQAQLAQAANQFAAEMALRERSQSFSESQAGKDDWWRAVELDLRARGMSNEEARDARNFLMEQDKMRRGEQLTAMEFINNAAANPEGLLTPEQVQANVQAAYDRLHEFGIGNISKYKTSAGRQGLNVGVSAVGSAAIPRSGGGTGTGYGSRALIPTTRNREPVAPAGAARPRIPGWF